MTANTNFSTTNPAQLIDRVTELQIAVQMDEANYLARNRYTAAGAMTWGGLALLNAGAPSAMTCAAPVAGSQSQSGNDFSEMKILALDAEAYTVTFPANTFEGADDVLTFGGAIGNSIHLVAYGGKVYVLGTAFGVTYTEV